MKKILILAIMSLLALVLVAGCEYSTANLQNVNLCDDPDGDDLCESDDSTFDADTEEIFVTGEIHNAPEDTDLTITWTYLGEEGDKPEEIDEIKLQTENTSNTFFSSLEMPPSGWPGGEYEIVLDLGTDNSDPITKTFTIEGDARPVAAGDDLISNLKTCDDLSTGDEACSRDSKTFDPETPEIFITGILGEVPPGTELTITWWYRGGGAGDEEIIDSVVLAVTEETPTSFHSNFPATADWPIGDYEIVMELDGKKEATKRFSVE